MNTLSKVYCRTFQAIMKLGHYFLNYRTPETMKGAGSIKRLPALLQKKGIKRILVVTDASLMKLGLPVPMLEAMDEITRDTGLVWLVTKANADAGGQVINEMWDAWGEKHPDIAHEIGDRIDVGVHSEPELFDLRRIHFGRMEQNNPLLPPFRRSRYFEVDGAALLRLAAIDRHQQHLPNSRRGSRFHLERDALCPFQRLLRQLQHVFRIAPPVTGSGEPGLEFECLFRFIVRDGHFSR